MTPARHQRWVVALAALVVVAGTARLGVWQLDRAGQKQALQQAIRTRGSEPPLDNAGLALDPTAAAQQHYRPVRLRGLWLAQHTLYLDNRQMGGRPGFFVLTPLQLTPGDAVIVQRGWAPRDAQERTRLPSIPTSAEPVEIVGRIAPPPSRLYEFDAAASGPIRQNLDLAAFARETGLALRPLSVQQLEPAGAAAHDGLLRDWSLPPVDIAKHHGYAFQWFALSALVAGLYVWFQLLRPRLGARRAD